MGMNRQALLMRSTREKGREEMKTMYTQAICTLAFAAGISNAGIADIHVDQDYMSSGFFMSDFLRGEEANSSRASNRATSPVISGFTGETSYFSFNFDRSQFNEPVDQAMFRVENVSAGFFPDVSFENPAEISLHSLTSNPLVEIDQDLASGAGSWIDYRDSQITTSSIIATSTIDSFGIQEWDITALVNEWIANGDTNFSYTLGTLNLNDSTQNCASHF